MAEAVVLLGLGAVLPIVILLVAILARYSRDSGIAVLLGTISHAVGLVALAGILTILVPRFKKLFEDFDTEVPSSTMAVFRVSDWFLRSPATMALLAGAVAAGIVTSACLHGRFCSELESRPRAHRASFWTAAGLAGLVLALIAMLATPMVSLLVELS